MTTLATSASRTRQHIWADGESLASGALLAAVLLVGLVTIRDQGITIDEFVFDEFGPKMLDWYLSGFHKTYSYFDEGVVYYGPWFQILVAIVQSLTDADRFDVRHAVTFMVGLAGLAAVVPIGRIAIGRWAGFAALVLCLLTGNLYGHLFFSPYDTPFLATMTWAVLAILLMARREVPSWRLTVCAGALTGLALATRVGGLITDVYLAAAMGLTAVELFLRDGKPAWRGALWIGAHAASAMLIGWIVAFALWPWVQTADPLGQFNIALAHFSKLDADFSIRTWGRSVPVNDLPWSYVPGELLARLPEGFIILLVVAFGLGCAVCARFVSECIGGVKRERVVGLKAPLLALARARGLLIIAVAGTAPLVIAIVIRPTVFDGIRHFLFVVPMLALLAAWALWRMAPLIRKYPIPAGVIAAVQIVPVVVTLWMLHPLEYIATNAFAGGTRGSFGRFDLDYWAAAATEAVRRLEQRLAADTTGRFASRPPRVRVCIPWREPLVGVMFKQKWIVEADDPAKADFVIETERSHCAAGGRVIDEVRRFDRTFAWTVEQTSATAGKARPSHAASRAPDEFLSTPDE
jgi:hypothetical protein